MPSLIVSYPRENVTRFDEAYYTDSHIPMAQAAWTPHGMTSAQIHFPTDAGQPFAAMAVLGFASEAAIDASLGDPATPGILADIANFTDGKPMLYRSR